MHRAIRIIFFLSICVSPSEKMYAQAEQAKSLIDCEDLSQWKGMVNFNTSLKRSGRGSFDGDGGGLVDAGMDRRGTDL